MNVRHVFPESDPLIAKHVKLLNGMDAVSDPDIVHVHG